MSILVWHDTYWYEIIVTIRFEIPTIPWSLETLIRMRHIVPKEVDICLIPKPYDWCSFQFNVDCIRTLPRFLDLTLS